MTISYPLTLVDTGSNIARIDMQLVNVTAMNESPFTKQQQIYQHQGQVWRATLEFNPLPRAAGEDWIAFFASLMGRYGTFTMGDPTGQIPRGTAGGTPKVSTASQTGNTLQIYSATGSVANWLRKGDYVQLGTAASTRLHKVLNDINTTSGGVATLDIWPRLRSSPASGAALYVNSCVGLWRGMEDTLAYTIDGPTMFALTFAAIEAI